MWEDVLPWIISLPCRLAISEPRQKIAAGTKAFWHKINAALAFSATLNRPVRLKGAVRLDEVLKPGFCTHEEPPVQ